MTYRTSTIPALVNDPPMPGKSAPMAISQFPVTRGPERPVLFRYRQADHAAPPTSMIRA